MQWQIPYAEIPVEYNGQSFIILIDLQRPKDAEAALAKAMHWNPACAQIAFERAETCKLQGDMEGFFRLTLDTFKYAFSPKQVARYFRNLGFYFTEKGLWEESVACHTLVASRSMDIKWVIVVFTTSLIAFFLLYHLPMIVLNRSWKRLKKAVISRPVSMKYTASKKDL